MATSPWAFILSVSLLGAAAGTLISSASINDILWLDLDAKPGPKLTLGPRAFLEACLRYIVAHPLRMSGWFGACFALGVMVYAPARG